MAKHTSMVLAILLCSSVAHAQGAPPGDPGGAPASGPPAGSAPAQGVASAPPPGSMTAPPPAPTFQQPPAAVAPAKVPPAFLARVLSYDDETNQVVMGSAHRPLSQDEMLAELDRPDLVEKVHAVERRRLIFAISGGAVFAAGMITAGVARAGMPNLNSAYCTADYHVYNEECVPEAKQREVIMATGLIGGIGIGGLLGALAIASSPGSVFSKDETQGFIATHNATLLKRAREGASRLRLSPVASTAGGGLWVTYRF
ncbi:MAG: hypothetical protein U0359_25795 [Byssovorax sp.]